jgi:hypothetical protein
MTTLNLSLKETWHLNNGPATAPVRTIRYAVQGMPVGELAEIAELPQRNQWSILRTRQGVVGRWSHHVFSTPEDALSALRKDLEEGK